jgi:hypothetical protein
MYSRQHRTSNSNSNNSNAPALNQFAPRPFVVQPQVAEPTTQETPAADLQTEQGKTKEISDGFPDPSVFTRHVAPPKQPRIQMKLTIGKAGDKYEQEADKMAANVVQQINAPESQSVQRQSPDKDATETSLASASDRQDSTIEKVTSRQGLTIQRLALQYGNKPPIPEDANNLAAIQDGQRNAKIGVQEISGNGGINIPDQVYKDMSNGEDTFLVAHGRPALGDQPAMLESGDDSTLDGSNVAGIINTIRSGLKKENKTLGNFKIEACMSSLSRKTSGGRFGGAFVKEKSSLLDDTKKSLKTTYKVTDITLKGNLGFSAGSELEGGVENTTPAGTEIGLLDPLSAGIREGLDPKKADPKKVAPMIADALNIVDKQKALLNAADKDRPQLMELHNMESTAEYLAKAFADFKTDNPPDFTLDNVITVLVAYVKSLAQK